jgi:hypothetical protein
MSGTVADVQKCLLAHDKSFAPFRTEELNLKPIGNISADQFYVLAREALLKGEASSKFKVNVSNPAFNLSLTLNLGLWR